MMLLGYPYCKRPLSGLQKVVFLRIKGIFSDDGKTPFGAQVVTNG